LYNTRPNRPHPARSEENIAAIAESVRDDRSESIRRRSQQLGLSYVTTYLPNHHHSSLWALKKLEEDPLFSIEILFSDKAHFWLNGYVNEQNCRIWIEEQPEEVQELPLHPDKTTVWCGLWAGRIMGPYFFKNRPAGT